METASNDPRNWNFLIVLFISYQELLTSNQCCCTVTLNSKVFLYVTGASKDFIYRI